MLVVPSLDLPSPLPSLIGCLDGADDGKGFELLRRLSLARLHQQLILVFVLDGVDVAAPDFTDQIHQGWLTIFFGNGR